METSVTVQIPSSHRALFAFSSRDLGKGRTRIHTVKRDFSFGAGGEWWVLGTETFFKITVMVFITPLHSSVVCVCRNVSFWCQ